MTKLLATIISLAAFAGVVAVMVYIQRKASPVADNIVPFPEYEIDGQKFNFI